MKASHALHRARLCGPFEISLRKGRLGSCVNGWALVFWRVRGLVGRTVSERATGLGMGLDALFCDDILRMICFLKNELREDSLSS